MFEFMLHLNPNRIAILFVAAIISLVTGCSRESRIARHLEKGEHYFQQREFDQAEIEYLNVLKDSESHPDALRRLGRIYYEEGKVLRARSFLLKARDLDTNHLDTRLSTASWLCYAGGMSKEAREESLFVLTKDPGNDRALELLADSAVTAKDVDDARRQLERLRPAAVGKSGFHLAIGRLALRSDDPSAAESAFKQALAINPKSASAHVALARLHVEKNDLKSAEQSYKTAAELAPVGSEAGLHYATFKTQHGDANGGKQLLTEMTKRTPWYLPAWNRLAELTLAERNYEECAVLIRKILLRDPANLDALFLSGRLSSAQRNFTKATTDFEQLVKLSPRSAPVHYQLAMAHLLNRGSTEMVERETDAQRADRLTAVSHLQQAISLEANYTDAILLLSKLQISHGDYLAAIKRLSEYLEKHPKLEPAYLLLVDAYRVQNNYDQALAVGRRFAAAFPTNPEPRMLIGRALVQLKREAEARQAFHQALDLSPNYLEPLKQLVSLDINAKKYDSALALLRPLHRSEPKLC